MLDQSKIRRYIGSLDKTHHTNYRMAGSMMKNIAEAETLKHLQLGLGGINISEQPSQEAE